MRKESVNRTVVVLLAVFISAVFLSMIRQFLLAIFLAGIFSALAHPLYRRLERWFGGRRVLASISTLAFLVIVVLIPLGGLIGIITAQALKVGQSVTPWVQEQISEPGGVTHLLRSIPFYDAVEPYQAELLKKAGEAVGKISNFLIKSLSSATLGTVNFIFTVFVMLYTMFFFLMDGDKLLKKILYYIPLNSADEQRLLEKFTSVTRATLKGTAVIGILQGGLAGAAFAVVGITSAVFWAAIMTVLSIIPGIGSALVWGPAAILLAANGHFLKAFGLAAFCGAAVGSIDNFLRPALVGKDTQMHELMIFFGTLGGIVMFGITGFIIGPIVAALFITIWDIYGVVFQDLLPKLSPEEKNRERSGQPQPRSARGSPPESTESR